MREFTAVKSNYRQKWKIRVDITWFGILVYSGFKTYTLSNLHEADIECGSREHANEVIKELNIKYNEIFS